MHILHQPHPFLSFFVELMLVTGVGDQNLVIKFVGDKFEMLVTDL